jgi:hypothetical protein
MFTKCFEIHNPKIQSLVQTEITFRRCEDPRSSRKRFLGPKPTPKNYLKAIKFNASGCVKSGSSLGNVPCGT